MIVSLNTAPLHHLLLQIHHLQQQLLQLQELANYKLLVELAMLILIVQLTNNVFL